MYTILSTKRVIFIARRSKNMHAAELEITQGDDLTCLSAQSESAEFRHMRLVHVSSSLIKKLVSMDLVRGLPIMKFNDSIVCDACVKGKQTKGS